MKKLQNSFKIIKLILIRTGFLIIVSFLVKSIYYYNKDNNLFIAQDIIIEGTNYLNTDDITNLVTKYDGKSIFQYDIRSIKKDIESESFIKTTKIKIKDFRKLHVEIIERNPIALIIYDNEQTFIDIENTHLPVDTKSLNSFPVPVINIQKSDFAHNQKNIATTLIKYILTDYTKMYDNISEISISPLLITIITDQKTKIFIDPNMPLSNIDKLRKFENSIKKFRNIDDYQYIDLQYEKQIVVKERNYL